MRIGWRLAVLTATLGALLPRGAIGQAAAQSPAEFYRGKTVEIYIGYSVGGGYDIYARMLARHMGKHLAGNPAFVAKNMEGASGVRLANWLYGAAPRDGTVLGATSRAMAFEPLLGNTAAQYDGTRFTYIGSANDEVSVCVSWHTSGVARWEDARTRELLVGASGGPADDASQYPSLLNNMLGTRFKIINGYPGGNEINLAMERGEVQGRCGIPWSTVKATRQSWIDKKEINLLMQFSLAKHKDLPDVPLVLDLATSDEQRRIIKLVFGRQVMGRPFAAPPGVPESRVAALRKAFMDTMADPEFVAEVVKAKFEVTPVSGAKLEELVLDVYTNTPPELTRKAAAMMK